MTSDFFKGFLTYLPTHVRFCPIVLVLFYLIVSDFCKPTYLPKNRTSYVDGPLSKKLVCFCNVLFKNSHIHFFENNQRDFDAFMLTIIAPSGWKFLPREFGEIGGSNIEIKKDYIQKFAYFDRALMTNECIDLYRKDLPSE